LHVKITKIFYIGTLFKVRLIEDFGLLSVRFRQLSLNIHEVSDYEVKYIHFSCYNYGAFY